jgi:hypothetical protein
MKPRKVEDPQYSADESARRRAALRELQESTRTYRQPADLRHAEAIIDSMLRGCSQAMGVLNAARIELREKAARQEAAQAGRQPPNGPTRL